MATRTPEEQKVHEDIERQLAAGGDPFGDDEELGAPSIESQAAAAQAQLDLENGVTTPTNEEKPEPKTEAKKEEPAEGATESEGGTTDAATETTTEEEAEPDPKALAAIADEDDGPAPARFQTADRKALDTDRATLLADKAKNLKSLMDGEMTPEDYAAKETEIASRLEAITVQRTLIEANAQNETNALRSAVSEIMETAKDEGTLDYLADKKAQSQFDLAFNMLRADPDNAKRSPRALAREAHASVLAIRGISKAAATPAATKPPAREPGKAPITLRDVPAAATANAGGTKLDAVGQLRGQDFQNAWSKLSAAEKAKLLDD